MVVLASNPSTLEAVAGVQSQPGLQSKTLSQKEAERSRIFLLWTMMGGPPDVWPNIPKSLTVSLPRGCLRLESHPDVLAPRESPLWTHGVCKSLSFMPSSQLPSPGLHSHGSVPKTRSGL